MSPPAGAWIENRNMALSSYPAPVAWIENLKSLTVVVFLFVPLPWILEFKVVSVQRHV